MTSHWAFCSSEVLLMLRSIVVARSSMDANLAELPRLLALLSVVGALHVGLRLHLKLLQHGGIRWNRIGRRWRCLNAKVGTTFSIGMTHVRNVAQAHRLTRNLLARRRARRHSRWLLPRKAPSSSIAMRRAKGGVGGCPPSDQPPTPLQGWLLQSVAVG